MGDVNVLMAAVDQRDDQGVEGAALARLGIVDQAQASEVDLGKLAGGNVGDADRDAPLVAEAAVRATAKRCSELYGTRTPWRASS